MKKLTNMRKAITAIALCLFLALAAISPLGTSGINAGADGDAPAAYEVAVNVYPDDAEVTFYETAGFTPDMYDIPGAALDNALVTDQGKAGGYRTYKVTLAKGTYSYRGKDAAGDDLGGMAFSVPKDIPSDNTLVLKLWEFKTSTTFDSGATKLSHDDYRVELMSETKNSGAVENSYVVNYATAGKGYIDDEGYGRQRFLVLQTETPSIKYIYQAVPNNALTESRLVTSFYSGAITPAAAASDLLTTFALKTNTAITKATITVPTAVNATVKMIYRVGYYLGMPVPLYRTEEAGDKTNWEYYVPQSAASPSGYTYVVTAPGKINRAGYVICTSDAAASIDIEYKDNEDPTARPDYSNPNDPYVLGNAGTIADYDHIPKMNDNLRNRMQDNLLMNINTNGHLKLSAGDNFVLMGYRDLQVISDGLSNKVLEPNFNFKSSDEDVVGVSPIPSTTNWANITAKKPGTAVIEVTYDAMIVLQGPEGFMPHPKGFYGASDPALKGVFVVTVDAPDSTDITLWDADNPAIVNGQSVTEWDSEQSFALFFDPAGADFVFTPKAADGTVDSVELNGAAVTAGEGGSYAMKIPEGNNILRVASGDKAAYQIIRGKKITPIVENVTAPGAEIKVGDKFSIAFTGLVRPLQKMSGIYNNSTAINYTLSDGTKVTSPGGQYYFLSDHKTQITAYAPDELVLSAVLSLNGSTAGTYRVLDPFSLATQSLSSVHTAACPLLVFPEIRIMIEEVPDITAWRNDARQEVQDAYDALNLADYYETQQSEIEGIYSAAMAKISTLFTETEINAAMAKAVSDFDAVFTKTEFEAYVTAKKAEVSSYKTVNQYPFGAVRNAMNNVIKLGSLSIDNALTVADIDTSVTTAKALLDTYKTMREAAKTDLESYKSRNDYRAAEQAEFDAEIAAGKTAIDNATATNATAINNALNAAKTKINAIKTDAQLTAEEAALDAAELAAKKTAAKTELETYKDADDYRDGEKGLLNAFVTLGKSAIDGASDEAGVTAALNSAKTEIDNLKTDAELTQEEEAAGEAEAELAAKKTAAKSELESYKDADDYRDGEKGILNAFVALGKSAIDGASDEAGVTAALTAAKSEIDNLKTDAELTQEEETAGEAAAELAAKKTAAKSELEVYKNADDYRDEEKGLLNAFVSLGKSAIDGASDEAGVTAALTAAKTEIDKLKTANQTVDETKDEGCNGSLSDSLAVVIACIALAAVMLTIKRRKNVS